MSGTNRAGLSDRSLIGLPDIVEEAGAASAAEQPVLSPVSQPAEKAESSRSAEHRFVNPALLNFARARPRAAALAAQANNKALIRDREQLDRSGNTKAGFHRLFQDIDHLPASVVRDRMDRLTNSYRDEEKTTLLPVLAAELRNIPTDKLPEFRTQIYDIVREISSLSNILNNDLDEISNPEIPSTLGVLLADTSALSRDQATALCLSLGLDKYNRLPPYLKEKATSAALNLTLDLRKLDQETQDKIATCIVDIVQSDDSMSIDGKSCALSTFSSLTNDEKRSLYCQRVLEIPDKVSNNNVVKAALSSLLKNGSVEAFHNLLDFAVQHVEGFDVSDLLGVDPQSMEKAVSRRGLLQALGEACVRHQASEALVVDLFSRPLGEGLTPIGFAIKQGEVRGIEDLDRALQAIKVQADDGTQRPLSPQAIAAVLGADGDPANGSMLHLAFADKAEDFLPNVAEVIAAYGELVHKSGVSADRMADLMSTQPRASGSGIAGTGKAHDTASSSSAISGPSGLSRAIKAGNVAALHAYANTLAMLELPDEAVERLLMPQDPAEIAAVLRDPRQQRAHTGEVAFAQIVRALQLPPEIHRRLIGFEPEEALPVDQRDSVAHQQEPISPLSDMISELSPDLLHMIVDKISERDTARALANLSLTNHRLLSLVRERSLTNQTRVTTSTIRGLGDHFLSARERGFTGEAKELLPNLLERYKYLPEGEIQDRIVGIIQAANVDEKSKLLNCLAQHISQINPADLAKLAPSIEHVIENVLLSLPGSSRTLGTLLADTSIFSAHQVDRMMSALLDIQDDGSHLADQPAVLASIRRSFPEVHQSIGYQSLGVDMEKLSDFRQDQLMRTYQLILASGSLSQREAFSSITGALVSISTHPDATKRAKFHLDLIKKLQEPDFVRILDNAQNPVALQDLPNFGNIFEAALKIASRASARVLQKLIQHATETYKNAYGFNMLRNTENLGTQNFSDLLAFGIKRRRKDIALTFANFFIAAKFSEADVEAMFKGVDDSSEASPFWRAIETGSVAQITDITNALLAVKVFEDGESVNLSKEALERIITDLSIGQSPLEYIMSLGDNDTTHRGLDHIELPVLAAYGEMVDHLNLDRAANIRVLTGSEHSDVPPLSIAMEHDRGGLVKTFGHIIASLSLHAPDLEQILTLPNTDSAVLPLGPHMFDNRDLEATPDSVASFINVVGMLSLPLESQQRLMNFKPDPNQPGRWVSTGLAGSNPPPRQLVWGQHAQVLDDPTDPPGVAAYKAGLRLLYLTTNPRPNISP